LYDNLLILIEIYKIFVENLANIIIIYMREKFDNKFLKLSILNCITNN